VGISIIIITKNEEAVIGRCLESVAWADEIVVVDSGSTDHTHEICHAADVKLHITDDWPGYGPQRNRAIDLASNDWMLALDADEWVTLELRTEIEQIMRDPSDNTVAWRIPRLSSYCGRYMRHGGWWPDYVIRLFRHGHARFCGSIVHERLISNGPIGKLHAHLMHEAFLDPEEVLRKINSYSTWGAQTLSENGKRANLSKAVGHGLWTFIKTYFFRLGFLDGREGFMLAVSNAEGAYYKYVKLMLSSAKSFS